MVMVGSSYDDLADDEDGGGVCDHAVRQPTQQVSDNNTSACTGARLVEACMSQCSSGLFRG